VEAVRPAALAVGEALHEVADRILLPGPQSREPALERLRERLAGPVLPAREPSPQRRARGVVVAVVLQRAAQQRLELVALAVAGEKGLLERARVEVRRADLRLLDAAVRAGDPHGPALGRPRGQERVQRPVEAVAELVRQRAPELRQRV